MNKNEILAILDDWNFWQKELNVGIKRNSYLEKFLNFIPSNQVLAITGARRSGKSFLMRQFAKKLIDSGVDKNRILIINFEDPRFTDLNTNLLQKIFETYLEILQPEKIPYLFLDEIQEVANWEKWVLTTQELNKARIIVSGSNANLLSQELASLLTGRHIDITVFPLSFREFLKFKNVSVKNKLDLISQRIKIKGLLKNYLESGSFPKVVLEQGRKEILLTYFDDILSKDLIKRYRVQKAEKLKNLSKFYFSNIASLTTFNSLEKSLEISVDTIEKFSNYLNAAYLIFFLKRFSFKVREQDKSPRKVYAIDTGLANAIGFRFSKNLGHLAENLVFLQLLRKKISKPQLDLYYWKDVRHREIDFIIKKGLKVAQAIQVCWELTKPETKNREISSLAKGLEELKLPGGLVITEDYEGKEKYKGKIIEFIPLWKWLLKS